MRILILFIALFSFSEIVAQIKVEATPTGRHADAINRARQSKETAERLQEQAEAQWEYKERYEQMKLDSVQKDSLYLRDFSREDSLAISQKVLEETDFPPEYRDLILNPVELREGLTTEQSDSVALARANAILEDEARKFLPAELGESQDPMDGLATTAIPSKPNPNLVKPEAARELFKKVDPEQFKEAQMDITKLKKKYSELPDTRYPEEGTKRNSLEDVPFAKRLYFGGNISIMSTDPFILNSNLQLGYWLNKKWLAGLGFIIREQFGNDSTLSVAGDGHGYSMFTRYDIPKGFDVWGEVERQINKSLFSSEQSMDATWQSAYLLGVGRDFSLGPVRMTSTILYDFNYQNNELNARPWVFRLGVQFSKRPGVG
ncbi:MAG: hypothetical protein RLN88_00230 [Ekhidna sp.]|uniref:hypothetical protein n=1 Tax=Ekhidna sp. TaxID=2608089 RepID=UPI0032EBA472